LLLLPQTETITEKEGGRREREGGKDRDERKKIRRKGGREGGERKAGRNGGREGRRESRRRQTGMEEGR